jgi:HK97 gp10 family phage protein
MPSKLVRGSRDRFAEAKKRAELAVAEASEQAAKLVQAEVVARVPVRTGRLRDFFASAEALGRLRKDTAWRFGLITAALREKAHYALFVEYGTKGYDPGETRVTRVSRDGKIRTKKVRRRIPARRAQPFFRPGIEAARAKVRSLIADAVNKALKD